MHESEVKVQFSPSDPRDPRGYAFWGLVPLVGSPMGVGPDKERFQQPLWKNHQANSLPCWGLDYRGPTLEPVLGRERSPKRRHGPPSCQSTTHIIGVRCNVHQAAGQGQRSWLRRRGTLPLW